MRNRYLVLAGALAVVITVVSVASVPLAGQGSSPSTTAWTPPRTPDGQPDLQGVWTNKTTTPLERPRQHAGKEFLTNEELAAAEKKALDSRYDADRRDQKPGSVTDLGRAYNAHWFDRTGHPSRRTALIVDPPDGKVPALTPEAQKRFAMWAEARGLSGSAANPEGSLWNGGRPGSEDDPEDGTEGGVDGRGSRADNPEDRRLSERCTIWAPLPRLPGGYNSNIQIVQTPQHVVLQMEMIHDARIIPLDGRQHLPQSIRHWFGDSRGRWEGNTLVIETTNFSDSAPFKGSFGNRRIVERLTRVSPNTINYEVTVTDPTTWVKPWTATWPLTALADGEDLVSVPRMFEYACQEGNYGLEGQLRGSRANDKVPGVSKAGTR